MAEHEETSTSHQLGALFSTAATDNAEVVPPVAHHGPDHMWSTKANDVEGANHADAPEGDELDVAAASHGNGHAGGAHRNGGGSAPNGTPHGGAGVYGAQGPAQGSPQGSAQGLAEEAVDGEVIDDPWTEAPHDGYHDGAGTPGDPWVSTSSSDATSAWSAPPRDRSTGLFSAEPVSRPDDVLDEEDDTLARNGSGRPDPGPWSSEPTARQRPTTSGESPFASRADHSAPTDPWISTHFDEPDAATDPNGLRAAVSRLDPRDVEVAAVPIAVCGALLAEGEEVQGAVTGQMLGRPAVVVLTDSRVLIVNDRRWQPIVDVFQIDSTLVVRGRHDRNVAALSFADDTRLAMVDGITEVALAIDMAERIRRVGSR